MASKIIPAHIRQLVNDQLKASVTTFVYDGKSPQPISPSILPKTILEHLWGLDEVALLHAGKMPEDMDSSRWKAGLEYMLGKGVQHEGKTFSIIGGSSSLKKGVFWLGTERMMQTAHSYFRSAQEALTYWGILISGNHHGIFDLNVNLLLVEDGEYDTGDGMGWIDQGLLAKLALPTQQMQVRFVSRSWLGKGTLHPKPDSPLFPDADLILPKSMLKGKGNPVSGQQSLTMGIRDLAYKRNYRSNFTFAQWFDAETLQALYPVLDAKLERVRRAMASNEAALEFLHLQPDDDEGPAPAKSKLEAYLQAGLSPRHPWIHRHLKELARRQYVTLALGGGIELTGFMGAYANLDKGVVCVPDLPEGPFVLSRYPIRDPHSLQPVWNHPWAVPHALPGSIYLSEGLAKELDGDYDGDFYVVNAQQPVVKAVWDSGWGRGYERTAQQAKQRRNDSLDVLPFVAVESLGNSIGFLTYLITASLLRKQTHFIPGLSAALQDEVQSLKWSTQADPKLIAQVENEVTIPDFLATAKTNRKLFCQAADRLEGEHPLIANYNHVVDQWQADQQQVESLVKFKPEIPLWRNPKALDCIEEAAAVVDVYNRWCGKLIAAQNGAPATDDLAAPIAFLESWARSKDEAAAWAVAIWNVVHGTRSDNSGSAAFHAFPAETVALLSLRHHRPSVQIPTGSSKEKARADVWMIPVVGGHHFVTGAAPREVFRQQIARLNEEEVVETRQVGEQTLLVCQQTVLGVLPKNHMLYGSLPIEHSFTAKIKLRDQTVWLLTTSLF